MQKDKELFDSMRNIVILNSLHFSYPLPILMRVSYNTLIVKQNTSDYYKYTNNSANDNLLVSEDSKIYKNIKNLSTEELALKASKQQEISLLQNLIRNYQDRIDLLQQELGQYKSE